MRDKLEIGSSDFVILFKLTWKTTWRGKKIIWYSSRRV